MDYKSKIKNYLDAGVHYGHITQKWNPKMAGYIFTERNGVHIIDLRKTYVKVREAQNALRKIAISGKKILFVSTKKQARSTVVDIATQLDMPYITERWPGGMLTNFLTIRKAIKKMRNIDRMKENKTFDGLSKRERLQINREREKLEKNLGSITDMVRLPAALIVVDIRREHIAIKEAEKLNIPVFAMIDTNADPDSVYYPIPSNDDSVDSIRTILGDLGAAISEGLLQRKEEAKKQKDIEEATAEDVGTSTDTVEPTADVDASEASTDTAEGETAVPQD